MTDQKDNNLILLMGFFSGWLSILVTNFFGFSVVIIGLLFFLIPAISFKLIKADNINVSIINKKDQITKLSSIQLTAIPIVIIFAFYLIFVLIRFWFADTNYAKGYNFDHANAPTKAFDPLRTAVSLNPNEPLYRDELSSNLASLSLLADNQKEATLTASLIETSINEENNALSISPNNVNLYKSQTKLYYLLSQIDPKYNKDALVSIIKASKLAPTDAKVRYNLALIYGRIGDSQKAIETLKDTIKLKPNYTDAYYALALYYKDAKEDQMAQDALQFILDKIDPANSDARKKLDEWTNIKGASESSESSIKKFSP